MCWLHYIIFQKNKKNKSKLSYKKCNASKCIGTTIKKFNKVILDINNKFHIEIKQHADVSIKKILHNQPIIILFHWYEDATQDNHYTLIDKVYINNGIYTFRVINYSFDKPIHIISERVLTPLEI